MSVCDAARVDEPSFCLILKDEVDLMLNVDAHHLGLLLVATLLTPLRLLSGGVLYDFLDLFLQDIGISIAFSGWYGVVKRNLHM